MANVPATASLIGGITLLERAITYTLGVLHAVPAEALSNPTPCAEWDLRALLRHLDDSLTALHEAVDEGQVSLTPTDGGEVTDPVARVRDHACRLLGAWTNGHGADLVSIAGCPITASIVAGAGAVEIAVHGWDVAEACGRPRPIPPELAAEMLALAPLFITDADRPVRFAPVLAAAQGASPSDRLVSFLGRRP